MNPRTVEICRCQDPRVLILLQANNNDINCFRQINGWIFIGLLHLFLMRIIISYALLCEIRFIYSQLNSMQLISTQLSDNDY